MHIDNSFKEIARDVWSNKPLTITVAVGLVAIAYMLYRRNQPVNISTGGAPSDLASGSTGTFVQQEPQYYYSGLPGATGPVGPMGPVGQPPKVPPFVGQPTMGLLGAKVQISQKNGVYVYKTPSGQSGFLSQVLPHGAVVRGGSQGRWWYIQNGLKYLITAGDGPAVLNNATDANAK